ncbi:MAG: hypothetical protein LJF06_05090 [Gemmatimonadetes bacterium]|nr:hypothetical protein [Gemmatimonadota bacterium]
MKSPLNSRTVAAAAAFAALMLAAGCSSDTQPTTPSTSPLATVTASNKFTPMGTPSGEHIIGNSAIEPAYNADSGGLMYLLTPAGAPLPAKANIHATSPLYMVVYPPGSTAAGSGAFNCMGVPGNCPDHAGLAAQVAVGAESGVYGGDYTAVPGHDHVADPPGKPDFNVAWEVIEVVFTNKEAANTRLTTDTAIKAAIKAGNAKAIDLGFAFNCSVVPASLYWRGTPVGG